MANSSSKNSAIKKIRYTIKTGVALHFQFSNWEAFQIKQCWYRCSELIQSDGTNIDEINNKYRITLEKPGIATDILNQFRTKQLPKDLYEDIEFPNSKNIYSQSLYVLNKSKIIFETLVKNILKI